MGLEVDMRRFEIKEQGEHVLIVDTEYDASIDILIFGQFPSAAHQNEYAEAIAQALNAAAIPTLQFSKYNEAGKLRVKAERVPETSVEMYRMGSGRKAY